MDNLAVCCAKKTGAVVGCRFHKNVHRLWKLETREALECEREFDVPTFVAQVRRNGCDRQYGEEPKERGEKDASPNTSRGLDRGRLLTRHRRARPIDQE